MDCKLIAFDLDGTLLDNAKRLPEENLHALCLAAERGVHIVPATGRILRGIPEELKALPFIRYYILSNGALVYDTLEEKTLHRGDIPLDLALHVMDHLDTLPVIYDCYVDGWGYITAQMQDNADQCGQKADAAERQHDAENPSDRRHRSFVAVPHRRQGDQRIPDRVPYAADRRPLCPVLNDRQKHDDHCEDEKRLQHKLRISVHSLLPPRPAAADLCILFLLCIQDLRDHQDVIDIHLLVVNVSARRLFLSP